MVFLLLIPYPFDIGNTFNVQFCYRDNRSLEFFIDKSLKLPFVLYNKFQRISIWIRIIYSSSDPFITKELARE